MTSCTKTDDSIIAEWLRSLGLQQYAADFYDNGYDELEVCKLIKDEDLDAIGVTHPLHRKIILDSVLILKSEGATSVYFTLEEMNPPQSSAHSRPPSHQDLPATRDLIYDVSPRPGQGYHRTQTPTQNSYSSASITLPMSIERLVKDKLQREGVDLSAPPYTQSGELCVALVTALAMRYSEELSQGYFQVMTVIEQMARAACPQTLELGKEKSEMALGSVNPPAVPTSPPPHNTHQIQRGNISGARPNPTAFSQYQRSMSYNQPIRMEPGGMVACGGNVDHSFGRTFQDASVVQRLPGCTCFSPPQMPSHTASCNEVAMLEQRRKEAMVQAKSGRMSANEALMQIKQCEKQKNDISDKKGKKKSTSAKIGEFFKLPSFRRKSKQIDKQAGAAKSSRSMSCSDACHGGPGCTMGTSLSASQLANELKAKCTCGLPLAMPASRSMNFTPLCACDECQKMRAGVQVPPPPSPMLSHRSTPVRGSARYPSNRRINADIVRAPPTCRQCNAPLNQPQKVLPKFYSPQVTRKTYQPLHSPTPHHYNKPVVDKFEAWYQQNLPSDDETRHLIDPNQSDDNSMNNASFDAFGAPSLSRPAHSMVTPPTRPAFPVRKEPPGVNNLAHSYHSDSLSSDDFSTRQQKTKLQSGSEASPTVARGRRDSGCYLSNENLNNNSSNSSTCEKNQGSGSNSTAAGSSENRLVERLRNQMKSEGIDLTCSPYTDDDGQWCVPISLVSRYAKLCTTDLTTVALAMDAARCADLKAVSKQCVPLSADTKRNPEQKRVTSVQEFLVLSGLPMYTDQLMSNGCDTLTSLAAMNEDKLKSCGITDPLHVEIIVSAINSTWNADSAPDQMKDVKIHHV